MKIEIVVDPARPVPPQSLVSRVAPPPTATPAAAAEGQVARLVYKMHFYGHFID